MCGLLLFVFVTIQYHFDYILTVGLTHVMWPSRLERCVMLLTTTLPHSQISYVYALSVLVPARGRMDGWMRSSASLRFHIYISHCLAFWNALQPAKSMEDCFCQHADNFLQVGHCYV